MLLTEEPGLDAFGRDHLRPLRIEACQGCSRQPSPRRIPGTRTRHQPKPDEAMNSAPVAEAQVKGDLHAADCKTVGALDHPVYLDGSVHSDGRAGGIKRL